MITSQAEKLRPEQMIVRKGNLRLKLPRLYKCKLKSRGTASLRVPVIIDEAVSSRVGAF